MASDGQLQFSVPDAVLTALNREHRKEALLGADFQLKERLLNAASLVVSSTPGTMWKALQKIARVFGLKATKGKATIDGKRNCFRCVEISISPGMLELVSMMKCSSAPDLGRALNDVNSSWLVAAKRASSTRLPKCVFNSAPLMYRCVIRSQTCSPTVCLRFPRVL